MTTDLLSEGSPTKMLSGKHSHDHGGCGARELRSSKRPKVSAIRQFPTNCVAIARKVRETCNAGETLVEKPNERLEAKPNKLPVEMLQNELKSESIPKQIDTLCSSNTSPRPCVLTRKYLPPKIRKGVTIFRDFPRGCGRWNLDVLPDEKSSEEKPRIFIADNEQIRGGSCDVASGFARKAALEDIDDKVKAETGKAIEVERQELFEKVTHIECQFNQEADIDTITITSSPQSNSLQANPSFAMTCNNNDGAKSWVERNGSDFEEYITYKLSDVDTGVVMHSVMNESVDLTNSKGGIVSATQQGVKTSDCAVATGVTDGCIDQKYELMGSNGSYFLLLRHDYMKSNASDCAAATGATDGCSDKKYELMGNNGSYYLLLIHDDTKTDVSDVEAAKHDVALSGKQSNDLTVNGCQEAFGRTKVREVLNLFENLLKKRLLEKKSTRKKNISSYIYLEIAMLLKKQKKWIYMNERVLGAIPGVEVGDQFHYRAELVIVGLHVHFTAGIDYMEKDGKKIATSIVSAGPYSNNKEFTDVLIYSGEGGNQAIADQNSKDRTQVQGNVALKNSMDEETPVRVIRGRQSSKGKSTFTYDGLYIVSKFWQERAQNGKLVHMFQLNKMHGQPKLNFNTLGSFGKSKARHCRTMIDDISYGKEKIPIRVVNNINNDKPPTFNYITKMVYPQLRKSFVKTSGCRCIDGCSDHKQCCCVVKNGGMVPFNENGALVEAKPIVHECGPSCKCPPSCKNRVSQHGLKFPLEVFKTKMRGWGVRSRNFISSGSFICEYVGELLNDKQAEERIGFDEYLFDIGDEDGFAIDAAQIGSIGRFVNHSCSPNLYAQDVLFDHDDKMMPHVMLFATKNIRPLQELTYDYNYKIDLVYDSNGNVKKKTCHCGAAKCTGRMY